MLALPQVTVIAVETRCHELARLALNDLTNRVQFGDVWIYTDRPELIRVPGARYIRFPDMPDKIAHGTFYYTAGTDILTTHAVKIEWDAGLRDPEQWTDDFLQYDYIGAPWPGRKFGGWDPVGPYKVGNGGFSLWSRAMCISVAAGPRPMATDMHVCRDHRVYLEKVRGMKYAPEPVAYRFSFEHGPDPQTPSFGYHDVFNWPLALDRDEIIRRTRAIISNEYVITRTPKLGLLAQQCPWLSQEIGPDFNNALMKYKRPLPRGGRQPRISSRYGGMKA